MTFADGGVAAPTGENVVNTIPAVANTQTALNRRVSLMVRTSEKFQVAASGTKNHGRPHETGWVGAGLSEKGGKWLDTPTRPGSGGAQGDLVAVLVNGARAHRR